MSDISSGISTEVIDPVQLKRIESVHRGFLYQHLYAVGCMIKLASIEAGFVAVERDEDIEIEDGDKIAFIQVKTRTAVLVQSDISNSLELFDKLTQQYAKTSPLKSVSFAVVSNVAPGPRLAKALEADD